MLKNTIQSLSSKIKCQAQSGFFDDQKDLYQKTECSSYLCLLLFVSMTNNGMIIKINIVLSLTIDQCQAVPSILGGISLMMMQVSWKGI